VRGRLAEGRTRVVGEVDVDGSDVVEEAPGEAPLVLEEKNSYPRSSSIGDGLNMYPRAPSAGMASVPDRPERSLGVCLLQILQHVGRRGGSKVGAGSGT